MDKTAIKIAVEQLIKTTRYIDQRRYILETVEGWGKRQIQFVGDDAPLNALVALGVESSEALANVFALVERKRRTIPTAKKIDYQRDYMRQRRNRLKMSIRLEEIVTGKRLNADERAVFSAATMAEWTKLREEELAKFPSADWKEKNEIVGEFWNTIDRRLEAELARADSVLDTPTHRKVRKVQVAKPVGILGEKLQSVLKKRKP